MTRWWLLAAIAAVVGVAGEARAETHSTAVQLKWENLPRTDQYVVLRAAKVPRAMVFYSEAKTGERKYIIDYDDGVSCGTSFLKGEGVSLSCGRGGTAYTLAQDPGGTMRAEWVTNGGTK
jgi:hypothetical protein